MVDSAPEFWFRTPSADTPSYVRPVAASYTTAPAALLPK